MKKQVIRITENDIHNIVRNVVEESFKDKFKKGVKIAKDWLNDEDESDKLKTSGKPLRSYMKDNIKATASKKKVDECGGLPKQPKEVNNLADDNANDHEGWAKDYYGEARINRAITESIKKVLKEDDEFEDDFDDTEYLIDDICEEFGDGEVVINGTLGLWDGEHTIRPVTCRDIRSAIRKCIGRDGEIFGSEDISFDGDAVNINVHHHDGTNSFTITRA